MNKELREDLEHLIICKDKSITQDLRDDIKMTLDYIDELQERIDKVIEYCEDIIIRAIDISDTDYELGQDSVARDILDILRGEDE